MRGPTAMIYDGDGKYVRAMFSDQMHHAIKDAIADAKGLVCDDHPRLFIRDALGGLRAEVYQTANEGTPGRAVSVKVTK